MSLTFDPQTFLHATFTEGVDVRAALHQPGDWLGRIGEGDRDIAARTVQTKDGDRPIWEVTLYCDDPRAQAEGYDGPARVRHTLWLDTNDTGGLDFSPGRNRDLGNLLLALGFQDRTGKLLRPCSIADWRGRPIRYTVTHEARKDNGELVARVTKIAAP